MTLAGKRILILGGSSGIGLAVAEGACRDKAEVVIVSHRQARIDAALERLGPGAAGHCVDLADPTAIAGFFDGIGAFDHLVYTAGDDIEQAMVADLALETAQASFGVRFWGALTAVKQGARLIRPGGSITFTSSTLPRRPAPGFAIGAAVVGAVEGLARSLALELAPVRVNAVAPGVIRTPLWERVPEPYRGQFFEAHAAELPVGAVGEPADVAEAYLFLMRSAFVTGEIISVDGGHGLA